MIRRRRFLPILAALVIAAVFTILAVVRAAAFDSSVSAGPTIRILDVQPAGQLARVRVRVAGWRPSDRWRIVVDGAVRGISRDHRLGLTRPLAAGAHRVRVTLWRNGEQVSTSSSVRLRMPRPAVTGTEIAAAGDIACDPQLHTQRPPQALAPGNCQQESTGAAIGAIRPAAVLALGDIQYGCPTVKSMRRGYGRSWGRYLRITHPVPGNHEYVGDPDLGCRSRAAAAYFAYFGSRAGTPGNGWYSFDLPGWHMVALNSACSDIGGCNVASRELAWLQQDLAAHPSTCLLVYWHRPRWEPTRNGEPDDARLDGFWRAGVAAGADVVVHGDEHLYARSRPLNAAGTVSTKGTRVFVAGTGGRSLVSAEPRAARYAVSQGREFGVVMLTLGAGRYSWQFVPVAGGHFTDYGSGTCS
jgi:acid phosphatase type 7